MILFIIIKKKLLDEQKKEKAIKNYSLINILKSY
jgi:hypothetical protein